TRKARLKRAKASASRPRSGMQEDLTCVRQPCRQAFMELRRFPAALRGPVDFKELARLAARLAEVIQARFTSGVVGYRNGGVVQFLTRGIEGSFGGSAGGRLLQFPAPPVAFG
ncbi:MAG TPA: hypothetical protein VIX19_12355, partial [Terriglobales bacterium]